MGRRWVEREAPAWVEKGIISREQADRIIKLYAHQTQGVGVLPLLGSILLAVGILSFVAANWQDIPQLARLALIIVVMCGFYAGGELFVRRGDNRLGIALVSLGVISFGAGIILIGQMFHLVAHHAGSFILWALAGTLVTYLYRSRYLYIIALILFNAAQFYSLASFDTLSYTAMALMVAGLGYYGWRSRSPLLIWCFSFSVTLHLLIWTLSEELPFMWMFIPTMLLYALGDWLKERRESYAMQSVPLAAAYLFAVVMVLASGEWISVRADVLPDAPGYLGALAAVFLLSMAGKYVRGTLPSGLEWILLVPFLYMSSGYAVLYLLALFLFSLYVLWRGYAEGWRFKINFGTLLFICSTLVAYVKLTWDFMDKSLFFILGGILLIGLSWFLNRRNKRILKLAEEANRHG
ncbi:Uncharacterized membrane protein [Paenibacillus sp. UNCCL117]|uniref:DUF2157 domain-containing protein n=1 Tax=unclassified Paenibacillus TaxID=185978 RepID=UPI00088BCECB|nr:MULTISPECIES: DUF2157 domain-containing protein [unclassified Paenibacillus]SDD01287.1 Uncharacterized membrane protein [Paenibacillus sp. cl123]SFW32705.1 Uncharacterized membrane protein [Paenibacillus sp. UNCCL117]